VPIDFQIRIELFNEARHEIERHACTLSVTTFRGCMNQPCGRVQYDRRHRLNHRQCPSLQQCRDHTHRIRSRHGVRTIGLQWNERNIRRRIARCKHQVNGHLSTTTRLKQGEPHQRVILCSQTHKFLIGRRTRKINHAACHYLADLAFRMYTDNLQCLRPPHAKTPDSRLALLAHSLALPFGNVAPGSHASITRLRFLRLRGIVLHAGVTPTDRTTTL